MTQDTLSPIGRLMDVPKMLDGRSKGADVGPHYTAHRNFPRLDRPSLSCSPSCGGFRREVGELQNRRCGKAVEDEEKWGWKIGREVRPKVTDGEGGRGGRGKKVKRRKCSPYIELGSPGHRWMGKSDACEHCEATESSEINH